MRRWLLLAAAAFIVVEALAALYAIWPSLHSETVFRCPEIRVGAIAAPPLGRSQGEWDSFAKSFSERYGCSMKVFMAASFEEGASGLLNGSLDLLYTDAAGFLELGGRAKLKTWFRHLLSKREQERMRAEIISGKPVSYIAETRGMRLALSGPSSMTGFYVPSRFLEERLPCKPLEWFRSIAVAADESEAFAMLSRAEVDLVASADISLDESLDRAGISKDSVRSLWLSMPLPENQLCSLESFPASDAFKVLEKAAQSMERQPSQEEFLSFKSMLFLPPDHSYLESLRSFQAYLEGPREGRSRTKVLKQE